MTEHLGHLRRGQHFIEIGPGATPLLVSLYLKLGGKADVTTIGLERLDPAAERALRALARRNGTRYQHKHGRFLKDYRPGQITPANYMLDQVALLAYGDKPQRGVEVEGRWLARRGYLQTVLPPKTSILDRNGRDVFAKWAAAIQGLKLVHQKTFSDGWHRAIWQRTGGAIRAPELILKRFVKGHPPRRVLLWDGQPPATGRRAAT
jgi:hypothetical protein